MLNKESKVNFLVSIGGSLFICVIIAVVYVLHSPEYGRQETVGSSENTAAIVKGLQAVRPEPEGVRTTEAGRHPLRYFPWPPPEASSTWAIPEGLLRGESPEPSLGDAADRLEGAVRKAGYREIAFYPIPGGFAAVAGPDRFMDEGKPEEYPSGRKIPMVHPSRFDLNFYCQALTGAGAGHYRLIVFSVTSQAGTTDETPPDRMETETRIRKGFERLPPGIEKKEFSPETRCRALVYEFEWISQEKGVTVNCPGCLSGMDHVRDSGILRGLQG